MLGDNSEKSKNPLKKAMRRRNAKTVNFAPPTYIEASDVEYSSDDDSEHGDFFNDDETVESEEGDAQEQTEDIVVEPLRPKAQKEKPAEQAEEAELQEKQEPERSISDPRRSSEEFFDPEGKQSTGGPRHSNENGILTLIYHQNPPSVDPEMVLYGTRTPSSRTTLPNRRKYLLHLTCCAMRPTTRTTIMVWLSGKR